LLLAHTDESLNNDSISDASGEEPMPAENVASTQNPEPAQPVVPEDGERAPAVYQLIAEDCVNPPAQSEVGSGIVVPISGLKETDWEPVQYFRDPLFSNPRFDINEQGALIHDPHPEEMNALRFFFKFWPFEVIESIVPFWKRQAMQDGIKALSKLDLPMFYAFLAARILMGVLGLSQREKLFTAGAISVLNSDFVSRHISFQSFRSIVTVMCRYGFDAYFDRQDLPDGSR
jgi:hypothetical protein